MFTTEIHHPELLRQAGHEATWVAGQLRNLAEDYATTLCEASRDLGAGNWSGELGGAMVEVSDTWREQTAGVVDTCRWLGEACVQAAETYLTNEAVNTEILSRVSPVETPFG